MRQRNARYASISCLRLATSRWRSFRWRAEPLEQVTDRAQLTQYGFAISPETLSCLSAFLREGYRCLRATCACTRPTCRSRNRSAIRVPMTFTAILSDGVLRMG